MDSRGSDAITGRLVCSAGVLMLIILKCVNAAEYDFLCEVNVMSFSPTPTACGQIIAVEPSLGGGNR
jgi:hypothetical protein